jgi:hypothetical protein
MGNKNIVDNTTNRGEFNRAYKRYLEGKGKISCTYCRYHRNENGKGRGYYGGYERTNGHVKIIYPNWKLVSSNRKQWMKKSMKVVEKTVRWSGAKYIDITW